MQRNPGQIAALAYIVNAIRPQWHRAGVESVIRSIDPSTPWPAICHAAIVAATTRPDQSSPAVIKMSGPHWSSCTGHKPIVALPSWRDPDADVTPADPDTIRAIRARKDRP